jgi:protein-tyrosine phosphatase
LLNLRFIDKKFALSGGFTDLPKDIAYLSTLGVVAILDVGMTPDDDYIAMGLYIENECAKEEIEYDYIPMRDDEFNDDIHEDWREAANILADWVKRYPNRRQFILIKCATGISRSASVLIYYLCREQRMSYIEALGYVRNAESGQTEFGVSLNNYFHNQLKGMFKDYTYD